MASAIQLAIMEDDTAANNPVFMDSHCSKHQQNTMTSDSRTQAIHGVDHNSSREPLNNR
jgi:hypothetical protein